MCDCLSSNSLSLLCCGILFLNCYFLLFFLVEKIERKRDRKTNPPLKKILTKAQSSIYIPERYVACVRCANEEKIDFRWKINCRKTTISCCMYSNSGPAGHCTHLDRHTFGMQYEQLNGWNCRTCARAVTYCQKK